MFFTRTQRYLSQIPKEDFRNRLVGNHLKIHDMDFEVYEKGQKLKIVPHAESLNAIKTLPITDVYLKEDGNKTEIIITSKIRKLDLGGPQLIMLFCAFLVVASLTLLFVGRERDIIYTLLGISTLVFGVFWVRMEMGYFDYVRKIREHVRSRMDFAA
jgi:hypothetical protein